MEISSVFRSGINSLLGGPTDNGVGAGSSGGNRSNNADRSGINFASNENKSPISYGSEGGSGAIPKAGGGEGSEGESGN